jgi:hypothetical protein
MRIIAAEISPLAPATLLRGFDPVLLYSLSARAIRLWRSRDLSLESPFAQLQVAIELEPAYLAANRGKQVPIGFHDDVRILCRSRFRISSTQLTISASSSIQPAPLLCSVHRYLPSSRWPAG